MPQYTFQCPNCRIMEDKIVSNFSDKVRCLICGTLHDNKIPSLSSFILKKGGVGWEKDGYSGEKK